MTILTTIPNGASNKDIRDTLNQILADVAALKGGIAPPTNATVTISAAQSKAEGNSGSTLFTYTVTRSNSSGAIVVPWTFAAGSTDANDYVGGALPAGGNVGIADGATTGTITVSVQGDTAVEADETFTISIAAPTGYAAGGSMSATGTILNDDTAALPKLAAAVARIKAGGTRAVVPCVGDSVTDGWGGGLTSGAANGGDPGGAGWSRIASWPHKLAGLLSAAGMPSRADAFFPGVQDGTTIAQVAAASGGALSFGAGWSVVGPGTNASLGGGFVKCDSGSSGALTFTPEFSANSFDFLVTGAGGLGTLTVSDASGVLGTIDETVAGGVMGGSGTAYRRVTITRQAGSTSPITVQRSSGGDVYINAIIPYDTASPRLELLNMGWPGSKTSDWVNAGNLPWYPLNALGIFAGYIDGTIIELGANDAAAGNSPATYQANLQAIVDKVSAYGDVLLAKCHHTYGGTGANELPPGYLTSIDAMQAGKNTAVPINFNAIPLVQADYYDSIHLSGQGYTKEANTAFAAFKAAIGIA